MNKRKTGYTLTRRELDVARFILEDVKIGEMARRLGISVRTVGTYRMRLLEKLRPIGVRGNVGIALHLLKLMEGVAHDESTRSVQQDLGTGQGSAPVDAPTGRS